jgi:ribosomal-protein-serine acetyltransferase
LTALITQDNIFHMKDIKPDRKKVTLTDGKILLRPYRMSDINSIYQAIRESIKEVGAWLPFAHEGYAIKETRDWLKKRNREWKKGNTYDFGIFDAKDGAFIGGCGLSEIVKIHRRANLGYWVRTSRIGQGVAPAATRLLAKWGFDVLKLNRIEIVVAVGNERSLRAAAKAGAKLEGILRNRLAMRDKAYDAVMHSLVPEDFKT